MKIHIDETLGKIKEWIGRGFHLKRSLSVPYLVYYDDEEKQKLSSHLDLTKLKLVSVAEFDSLSDSTR